MNDNEGTTEIERQNNMLEKVSKNGVQTQGSGYTGEEVKYSFEIESERYFQTETQI